MVEPRVLDLNSIAKHTGRMLERLLGEEVRLELAFDPTLAPVLADEGQMHQVLINLAVNARDAMPSGGTIRMTTSMIDVGKADPLASPSVDSEIAPGRYCVLTVSDSGIGMDDQTLAHIFEPFFTTKEKGKGTGLGLATVYGIVSQSGGFVTAESVAGRGSSFRILLPSLATGATMSSPQNEPAGSGGDGETILLVEDEAAVRDLVATALVERGYRLLTAADAEAALKLRTRALRPARPADHRRRDARLARPRARAADSGAPTVGAGPLHVGLSGRRAVRGRRARRRHGASCRSRSGSVRWPPRSPKCCARSSARRGRDRTVARPGRDRLHSLLAREQERFERAASAVARARHPGPRAPRRRRADALDGALGGRLPALRETASGARFTDVDGHEYVDFCLGDTGAMTGHAPAAAVAAIRAQLDRGLTFMLPTEDAIAVAEELARRFGLPYWQIATTATDANRFAIRLARQITGRPKILVFNWCYHGTVDETFAILDGRPRRRRAPATSARRSTRRSPPGSSSGTTSPALERELAAGDVACVLAEPAMTNIGIVLPGPGLPRPPARRDPRAPARCSSSTRPTPSRRARAAAPCRDGLEPDIVTVGKPLGERPRRRRPTASRPRSRRASQAAIRLDESDTGGIGGTLAGNALVARGDARHAPRGAHRRRPTPRMFPLAERFAAGVEAAIAEQRPALDRAAARCAGRVLVPRPPAQQRRRGGGERSTRSSTATCTSPRSTAASS